MEVHLSAQYIQTYRFKAQVMKIISSAKAKPNPTIIPYPKLCGKGAVKVAVSAIVVRPFSDPCFIERSEA